MQVGTIAVVAASSATLFGQLYVVIRKLSRLEFKVDTMWAWFAAASREHVMGRRKYDGVRTFAPLDHTRAGDTAHDPS